MNQIMLAGLAYAAGLATIPAIGWARWRWRPVVIDVAAGQPAAAAAAPPVTAHHEFDTMDVLAAGWDLGHRSAAGAPAAAVPTRKVDPVTDKLIPPGWGIAYATPAEAPNLAAGAWSAHEQCDPAFDPDDDQQTLARNFDELEAEAALEPLPAEPEASA